jgi:putative membrane protein
MMKRVGSWFNFAGVVVLLVSVSVPGLTGFNRRIAGRLISELYRSTQKDIQLGALAQEKGTTLQIRGLGESLSRDLQTVDDAVRFLARREGLHLSVSDPEGFSEIQRLQVLSGAAFDEAFVRTIIRSYERNRRILHTTEQVMSTGDAKELVQNILPTLQKHLDWASRVRT